MRVREKEPVGTERLDHLPCGAVFRASPTGPLCLVGSAPGRRVSVRLDDGRVFDQAAGDTLVWPAAGEFVEG